MNFEYNPQTVKDAMQGNEIVKITTSEPKPDQSAFAGMTEFQNIEFTALKQGEVTITLDGVASSTHTFGDVHKNFGGKTIKLHIRTYVLEVRMIILTYTMIKCRLITMWM